MQENINDVKREMGTLKKEAIRNVGDQKPNRAMKDTFEVLNNSLDMPKERISELLDITIEISKTVKHINHSFFFNIHFWFRIAIIKKHKR